MRKTFMMFVIICVIISAYTGVVFSQAPQDTVSGKHSAIVEADGFAFLSEDKTIRELREEARSVARREALEKGQTYIKSMSKVENFMLVYDLIESDTEGYVKILDSKDHGITEDNRYHFWIKAEIEYAVKSESASQERPYFESTAAPLSVSVWTEKQTYQQGENIYVFMKSNKDFYARVLYIDAQGNTLQLIPNQYRTNNFFPGGQVIKLPENDDGFRLEVAPPFGAEKIIVYASNVPQGDIQTSSYGSSLLKVNSDIQTVSRQTRGVMIKPESSSASVGAEFYETACELKTGSN